MFIKAKYSLKYLLPFALCFLFLSGCQTRSQIGLEQTQNEDQANAVDQSQDLEDKDPSEVSQAEIQKMILKEYDKWKKTPYRFGGNSHKGIDCSALVQRVFKEQFDMKLPRTTYFQRNLGEQVKRSDLEPGDLILFRIAGPTGRHIGIYVGDNKFMHASGSKGVIISTLENTYWKRHYMTARRVLDWTQFDETTDDNQEQKLVAENAG